jgi:hypothetical protein
MAKQLVDRFLVGYNVTIGNIIVGILKTWFFPRHLAFIIYGRIGEKPKNRVGQANEYLLGGGQGILR